MYIISEAIIGRLHGHCLPCCDPLPNKYTCLKWVPLLVSSSLKITHGQLSSIHLSTFLQGVFAETIRNQHLKERLTLFEHLEDAMLELYAQASGIATTPEGAAAGGAGAGAGGAAGTGSVGGAPLIGAGATLTPLTAAQVRLQLTQLACSAMLLAGAS